MTVPDALRPTPVLDLAALTVTKPDSRQEAASSIRSIALPASVPPGRFAISALEICARTASCVVAGWIGRNPAEAVTPSQLLADRPDFLFIKRDRDRISRAFWNCAHFKRSDPSQCLPPSLGKLSSLLEVGGTGG